MLEESRISKFLVRLNEDNFVTSMVLFQKPEPIVDTWTEEFMVWWFIIGEEFMGIFLLLPLSALDFLIRGVCEPFTVLFIPLLLHPTLLMKKYLCLETFEHFFLHFNPHSIRFEDFRKRIVTLPSDVWRYFPYSSMRRDVFYLGELCCLLCSHVAWAINKNKNILSKKTLSFISESIHFCWNGMLVNYDCLTENILESR